MGYTATEKIVLAHADVDEVAPGDVVMLRCDLVLTNDISGPMAIQTLERMGVERVFDPAKVVVVPDHFVPAKDVRSAGLQKRLKDWCDAQGVVLYDQGRGGIEHAVLVEDGWVLPGTVIAGGDSHTCTHGALGAFGTGLGSTDIAACLAYGRFWQAVPATIQVELRGRLGPFTSGKDVILAVIDELGVAGGNEHVLEFVGEGAAALTIDERLAVANMAVEAGSENGLFPADETTRRYLEGRARADWTPVASDGDAAVARRLAVDLDRLGPARREAVVAGQHRPARGRDRHAGRPGLHRELLERHDHRPPPGREHARGPQRPSADAGDRRPCNAADLRAGARRGTARGLRRGRSDGLDSHVRRVLRRLERHPRRRGGRRRDHEPQLPRSDGRDRPPAIYLANSYVAAAAAVAGEIVDPVSL